MESYNPWSFVSGFFHLVCFQGSSISQHVSVLSSPLWVNNIPIKDRNGRDLTEAEDIKKRWQQYTEELYKKDFHDPDNHDGVITYLEPDILECKVKWAFLRKHHYKQS